KSWASALAAVSSDRARPAVVITELSRAEVWMRCFMLMSSVRFAMAAGGQVAAVVVEAALPGGGAPFIGKDLRRRGAVALILLRLALVSPGRLARQFQRLHALVENLLAEALAFGQRGLLQARVLVAVEVAATVDPGLLGTCIGR